MDAGVGFAAGGACSWLTERNLNPGMLLRSLSLIDLASSASGSALFAAGRDASAPCWSPGLVPKLSACAMEEPWAAIQGPEGAQLCVVDMPESPCSLANTRPMPCGKLLPDSQPPLPQVWILVGFSQLVHLIPATMTGLLFYQLSPLC